jgi:hypothetical protein
VINHGEGWTWSMAEYSWEVVTRGSLTLKTSLAGKGNSRLASIGVGGRQRCDTMANATGNGTVGACKATMSPRQEKSDQGSEDLELSDCEWDSGSGLAGTNRGVETS